MARIREVSLSNFRGFKKLKSFRLEQLTFLVGPNSSGKSSVADALLFMAQSGFLSLSATKPIWIGPLVDLGSFKDTVYQHVMAGTVSIDIRIDQMLFPEHTRSERSKQAPLDVRISAEMKTAKDAPEGRLRKLSIRMADSRKGAELIRRRGRYESFDAKAGGLRVEHDPREPWSSPAEALSSALYGDNGAKKRSHPLSDLLLSSRLDDYAASIQRVSSGRNPPKRSYPRNGGLPDDPRQLLDGIDPTFLETGRLSNRKKLIRKLIDGLTALGIADDLTVERLSDYHTTVSMRDNLTTVQSSLTEFGYGASQVIPVLEGCASAGPGPLFIEQPEIHLHPRAQGELAQIICDASADRQMIIETHSEHMINRARRLIAENKLRASDVIIQYVDRDSDGSHATEIGIDASGDFTRDWPGGFYDERYHETMKIAEAQARRSAE